MQLPATSNSIHNVEIPKTDQSPPNKKTDLWRIASVAAVSIAATASFISVANLYVNGESVESDLLSAATTLLTSGLIIKTCIQFKPTKENEMQHSQKLKTIEKAIKIFCSSIVAAAGGAFLAASGCVLCSKPINAYQNWQDEKVLTKLRIPNYVSTLSFQEKAQFKEMVSFVLCRMGLRDNKVKTKQGWDYQQYLHLYQNQFFQRG